MMDTKLRLRIRLPAQLVKVIDILRTDASRSDTINYFLTWYVEQNLPKLMVTEKEMRQIRKLLSEVRE